MIRNNARLSPIARHLAIAAFTLLLAAGGCANQTPVETKPYAFWPPFPNEPRVLYLASYSTNTDIEPPKSKMDELLYGKDPQAVVPITHPYGLAMWNGRIYVCDTRNSSIEILDLRKHRMELMGAEDKMKHPVAIAIAPDGIKYVADDLTDVVLVFDASDHFIRQIGHDKFYPVGLAIHDRELYVTDNHLSHVEVFDRFTGQSLRMIGELGQKPGQLELPLGVAADADGNVYVDDIVNCRVQKFTSQGKLLGTFGSLGDNVGTFTRPKHIAVDEDGIVYVVDAAFQNVQMFDKQFHPLMFFGGSGNFPGAMVLPAGISIHDGDLDLYADKIPAAFQAMRLILVTNQFGDRVSVYAMGHLKQGHTVEELSASKGIIPEGTTTQPTTGIGAPLPDMPPTTDPTAPLSN